MISTLKLEELDDVLILNHNVGTISLNCYNFTIFLTHLLHLIILNNFLAILAHINSYNLLSIAHRQ